ncbi:MAG: tRNA uridine-5-carboxymethylaminomethyl(34) synthesis GTPase MnmE [Acidobacteriota bacterium]|nr:tRNA uridine-5-carboxymethylaminomethyl(34) synthesis GTPase MnmE [Acidobacteriota bacterium]
MFSTSDTIVAIATPAGRGGLGVIRISGPDAARVAGELVGREAPFKPRHATFAKLSRPGVPSRQEAPSRPVTVQDQIVVTSFPSPSSYTGEDVIEISAHGSPVVLSSILRRAMDGGARLAEPGEFTLRAFLNGKLDLIQAEAVADLIDAVTPLQARAAFDQLEGTLTAAIGAIERDLFDVIAKLEASLDFPDEGYHFVGAAEARASLAAVTARIEQLLEQSARGRLVREGAQVVIVGAPNVGKSSLFNALLNTNRAIVTAIPGTTRDMLTERADIGGLSLALVDTAGVRETSDVVEQEGVARTRDALGVADLVLVVLDRSRETTAEDRGILDETANLPRVVVLNKSDLAAVVTEPGVAISARTGAGIDDLITAIAGMLSSASGGSPFLGSPEKRDQPAVTNVRHTALLERARAAILRATEALEGEVSEEFPLLDLQEAAHALQEITGRRTSDDLLRHIFAKFCIGK